MTVRAPVAWGLVLASVAGTLVLGAGLRYPCAAGGFGNDREYRLLCYTDILPLLSNEQLTGARLPYLNPCAPTSTGAQCDEYPVLTMYFMRSAAWLSGGSATRFLAVNEAMLGACAVGIAYMLHRLAGARALFFALAPALAAYAFLNWDLFATLFAVAGLFAFLRRRDGLAGVMLGLGAAAKLYPVLFLAPLAVHRLRSGEPRRAARLAVGTAGAWAALNVPFALAAPHGWSYPYRLSGSRPVDFASLWAILCRHQPTICPGITTIDVLSVALAMVLVVVAWRGRARRWPDFPRWTLVFPAMVSLLLTAKLYSPQYGIWLLPLFALALPDVSAFAAFSVTDLAVFVATFRYLGWLDKLSWGWPRVVVEVAVAARAAVLVWCIGRWIRREPEPLPAEAESLAWVPDRGRVAA